jgi:hypothetical protein
MEELKAMMDDHQHPATRAMVETLALLEIQSKTEYRFLPYDSSRKEEWEKQHQAKAAAYNEVVQTLWKRVSSPR